MNAIINRACDYLEDIKKHGIYENGELGYYEDEYMDATIGALKRNQKTYVLVDFFKDIQDMFQCSDFTLEEKGFLVSRILQHNFLLLRSKPFAYFRPFKYVKDFEAFGIGEDEIWPIFYQYRDTGAISPDKITYIRLAKKFLDELFFPNENSFHEYQISKYMKGKNPVRIWSEELRKSFSNKVPFCSEEQSKLFWENFMYTQDIVSMMEFSYAISKEKALRVLQEYLVDFHLKKLEQEESAQIYNILEKAKVLEEKERIELVHFYLNISKFINHSRDKNDYQLMKCNLRKYMPKELTKAFLSYYESIDNKNIEFQEEVVMEIPLQEEVLEIPKIPRRVLKKELSSYVDKEEFDYNDYREFLHLLKELNYSDEVCSDYLSLMFQKKKDNYALLFYLYQKAKTLKIEKNTIEEMKSMLEEMMICNDNDYREWKEMLFSLKETLNYVGEGFYDYDLKLLHKLK